MDEHQRDFIEFAVHHEVLRFGSFTLKSGRTSPYFFNTGAVDTGAGLAALGRFYADTIVRERLEADLVFGPAYKGIPIAAATAVQLSEVHGRDLPWSFNRKEAKDHGEGGMVVGAPLAGRVLVVDDVITAGTAIREVVQILAAAGAEAAAIVVAIDRQERGAGPRAAGGMADLSAVQQVQQDLGVPVRAIVTLDDIVAYLEEAAEQSGHAAENLDAMRAYREAYGT